MSNRTPLASNSNYLTIHVGQQWYAMDVQYIFEVANMVAITQVPDMPDSIIGMVNIRGHIVPVLDLRIRFKMPDRQIDLTTPLVFVRHQDSLYGMIVDDIDDVITLSATDISTSDLQRRADHIQGLTDYRGKLIMILDPVRLMTSSLTDQTFEEITTQLDSGKT